MDTESQKLLILDAALPTNIWEAIGTYSHAPENAEITARQFLRTHIMAADGGLEQTVLIQAFESFGEPSLPWPYEPDASAVALQTKLKSADSGKRWLNALCSQPSQKSIGAGEFVHLIRIVNSLAELKKDIVLDSAVTDKHKSQIDIQDPSKPVTYREVMREKLLPPTGPGWPGIETAIRSTSERAAAAPLMWEEALTLFAVRSLTKPGFYNLCDSNKKSSWLTITGLIAFAQQTPKLEKTVTTKVLPKSLSRSSTKADVSASRTKPVKVNLYQPSGNEEKEEINTPRKRRSSQVAKRDVDNSVPELEEIILGGLSDNPNVDEFEEPEPIVRQYLTAQSAEEARDVYFAECHERMIAIYNYLNKNTSRREVSLSPENMGYIVDSMELLCQACGVDLLEFRRKTEIERKKLSILPSDYFAQLFDEFLQETQEAVSPIFLISAINTIFSCAEVLQPGTRPVPEVPQAKPTPSGDSKKLKRHSNVIKERKEKGRGADDKPAPEPIVTKERNGFRIKVYTQGDSQAIYNEHFHGFFVELDQRLKEDEQFEIEDSRDLDAIRGGVELICDAYQISTQDFISSALDRVNEAYRERSGINDDWDLSEAASVSHLPLLEDPEDNFDFGKDEGKDVEVPANPMGYDYISFENKLIPQVLLGEATELVEFCNQQLDSRGRREGKAYECLAWYPLQAIVSQILNYSRQPNASPSVKSARPEGVMPLELTH